MDNYGATGYYSTVGVVKYTSKPEVYIEGLNKNTRNAHMYDYLGKYLHLYVYSICI